MPEQSPGTVTFLFTDIEGSTRLWETEPTRMADALAHHDRLCRTAVETHGGRLVKMTGDGLHAVFGDPAAAVAAVLELQRGVAAIAQDCGIPFNVRCGLHAGIAQERDGDYFGSAVNRAARIMSAAHGGQILLSQRVVDLGRQRFPDGSDVVHLGRVRLRDLAAPEDVWQLHYTDLPLAFPALRSLDSTPNNLPQQLTSFIGREQEIEQIKSLFTRTPLLTLTGAGGCGKTRLALHVAAELLDAYPDGVWLVELAALADPALVPQTMAAVLGLREETGKSLAQTLTEHLKSRQVLLVLDNAEHLLGACAQLADALLRRCHKVVLLVSSREALGIAGELTFRVPSLPMPDAKRDITPERVARHDSVRLFVERAQACLPQFTITRDNAAALASICARLDGIPLALELAAARMRSMSVDEVNRRLDQRFRLLTGGSRTALPRQQTLRSLIDWSYDLLDDSERAMLRRLAVFAGGWTLDAAEAVCCGEGVDSEMALDLLTSLVDKSLVQADEHGNATRYRMLETVRQYARDRLLESGGGERWRDRHLGHFLHLAEEAEPHLTDAQQRAWFNRLETEHDNLRAALGWSSADGGDAARGLALAGALWRFWSVRGYPGEGRGWFAGLLGATSAVAPLVRAKALSGAGVLAREQGDYVAASAQHEESLAIRRALNDPQGIANSLSNLGSVAREEGDFARARALHGESLALRRAAGDLQGIATSLNNLGLLAREQGDYAAARRHYDESLAIDRQIDDRRSIAVSLNNLGGMAFDLGDYAAARELHEESLAIRRELGDRRGIASSLTNLGDVTLELGHHAAAQALIDEGLAIRRELGDRRGIAISLSTLGCVAHARGDTAAAQALHAESLAIRRALGDRWAIATSLNYLGTLACELGDPSAARAMHAESLAFAQALDDRWGIAEALAGLAAAAAASSDLLRAARNWGTAERLREELSAPLKPSERPRHDRLVAFARGAHGDDAEFDAAWKDGRAMAPEAFVLDALATPQT
jgi:predicted ATPase/class 3 adenylate cyclase